MFEGQTNQPPAAPVAAPPPAPPVAPVAAAPPPAPAPAAPPPAAPPAPAPVLGRNGQPMDEEAIAERTARERRKFLKDTYGTTDEAEIEKIKARRKSEEEELQALRAHKEKQDRENMSEVQKLQADLATVTADRDRLKAEIETLKAQNVAAKQDALITGAITRSGFRPDQVTQDAVRVALRRHFNGLSQTAQKLFNKTGLDAWMKKFAKENPHLVAPPPAAPAAAPAPKPAVQARPPAAPQRVPAGGPRPPAPPSTSKPGDAADPLAGKTVLPGRPNSMTAQELKLYEERRRKGQI